MATIGRRETPAGFIRKKPGDTWYIAASPIKADAQTSITHCRTEAMAVAQMFEYLSVNKPTHAIAYAASLALQLAFEVAAAGVQPNHIHIFLSGDIEETSDGRFRFYLGFAFKK